MNDPTTGTREAWHCPSWCVDAPEDHAAESQALDGGAGGALHHSQRLTVPGAPEAIPGHPAWKAYVGCRTLRGGHIEELNVYADDDEMSPEQARLFALNILHAVEMATTRSGARR